LLGPAGLFLAAFAFRPARMRRHAAGQFRGGEQLVDPSTVRPGTILTFLEPLEKDGLADVTAGSSCTPWSPSISVPSDLDLEHELNSVLPVKKTLSQFTFSLRQFLAGWR
jgi:hypothetical protein